MKDNQINSYHSNSSQSSQNSTSNYDSMITEDTAICADCGKKLNAGWHCSSCRRERNLCHRALSNNWKEYCTRCYILCPKLGLCEKNKHACQEQCRMWLVWCIFCYRISKHFSPPLFLKPAEQVMTSGPEAKRIKLSLEPFIDNKTVDITNTGHEILKT